MTMMIMTTIPMKTNNMTVMQNSDNYNSGTSKHDKSCNNNHDNH